ncbi:hypothetical protein HOLleu_04282 [Holothuria leucospilota]|uniref:Uncharacterized protein n=1 Tax=Holothuria leucospilota TaxID=206669 RepID=A0A9Q1CTU8_HOLLE|nr:hypothetical protein HOLleu_04282 [Holothuria leucospilota]
MGRGFSRKSRKHTFYPRLSSSKVLVTILPKSRAPVLVGPTSVHALPGGDQKLFSKRNFGNLLMGRGFSRRSRKYAFYPRLSSVKVLVTILLKSRAPVLVGLTSVHAPPGSDEKLFSKRNFGNLLMGRGFSRKSRKHTLYPRLSSAKVLVTILLKSRAPVLVGLTSVHGLPGSDQIFFSKRNFGNLLMGRGFSRKSRKHTLYPRLSRVKALVTILLKSRAPVLVGLTSVHAPPGSDQILFSKRNFGNLLMGRGFSRKSRKRTFYPRLSRVKALVTILLESIADVLVGLRSVHALPGSDQKLFSTRNFGNLLMGRGFSRKSRKHTPYPRLPFGYKGTGDQFTEEQALPVHVGPKSDECLPGGDRPKEFGKSFQGMRAVEKIEENKKSHFLLVTNFLIDRVPAVIGLKSLHHSRHPSVIVCFCPPFISPVPNTSVNLSAL